MAEESLLFSDSWHLVAHQRVKLRTNLFLRRQNFRGEPWFVVGDPYRNQYYRLRPAAYYFLARLDGKRTVEEVWKEMLDRDPEATPGQQEIIQALSQLYQANLLASEHPSDSAQLFARMRKRQFRKIGMQIMHFLFIRIPMWDPDPFLNRLRPLAKLLVRPSVGILWLAVVMLGIKVVIDHFDDLWAQGQGLLAPGNLIPLYLCWAIVKFLHECGHGLVCKRYGGEVHTMGIMLLVFMPIPYVDASSAWAFRERKRRVLVGSAGMLVELFCAAIAAFIWTSTGSGTVNQLAYNVMFLASVSTLLFNGNPLLRFDGYYILSDLVDVPNLHQKSFQQQKHLLERRVFGLKESTPPARTNGEAVGLSTFNIASTIYRLFVLTVIILFIAGQFFGIGLLLAVFAIVVWGIVPVGKFFKYLVSEPRLERVRPRALTAALLPLTVVLIVLAVVPFPQRFRAPGVVSANQTAEVIAGTDGTIAEIVTPPGEWVAAGQPLALVRNAELDLELARLRAEESEIDARLLWVRDASPAYIEPVRMRLKAVRDRIDLLERTRELTTVTAAMDGVWSAPGLDGLPGMWVSRGTALGEVVDTRSHYFSAIVSQSEAAELFGADLRRADIRLRGRAAVALSSERWHVVPVERERLPTASLGWMSGGEIEVAHDDEAGTQTVEPFFEVRLEIAPDDRVALRHLRSGVVRFTLDPQPLLAQWWRKLRQLLQDRYQI